MSVSFRDIDFLSDNDCLMLANWFNQDVDALSLTAEGGETLESVRKSYTEKKRADFEAFFICVEGIPVGYCSFFLDPSHKKSSKSVAWPSIAIGETSHRRKGLVKLIEKEVGQRAKKYGATHIEAGIFKHNIPMIKLLEKYGYERIGSNIVGPAQIESYHYLKPIE